MNADLRFLEEMTADVVEASRVKPGERADSKSVSRLPCTVIRPCGGEGYPSLWTRDFAMSVECGAIGAEEVRGAITLLADTQALADVALASGSAVPRGSIADHVNFQGEPIFYPGTYDPRDQGGRWGKLPSLDDQFYFVFLVWYAAKRLGWTGAPGHLVGGLTLVDRSELAFAMPPVAPDAGLVHVAADHWGVSFGFTDSVKHTGNLLFASLLRAEAAGYLAELSSAGNDYASTREAISLAIVPTFGHSPSGLLRAATETSGQPDLWGTAYALYRGLVPAAQEPPLRLALARAIRAGGASWEGQIRHVPEQWDFDAEQVWEAPINPVRKGRYQHGAYWATPLGWVLDALAAVDLELARTLLAGYLVHLRREDFREHGRKGAPWECAHPDGYRQCGVYMTSVAAVLPAARRLLG